MSAVSGNRALDRFVALLFALAESDRPLATDELAARAGLPASSTYRLVAALEEHGLAQRRGRNGVSPGLRILELASHVEERLELEIVAHARPIMRELATRCGETALLTAPVASNAIGLTAATSLRPVRLTYARWRMAPMHRGATGKVLLANLDPPAADRVLADAAAAEPELDVGALREQLRRFRSQGYVLTESELDEGVSAIAAPILDGGGRLLAGLAVAGPTTRVHAAEKTLVAAVVRAARRIGNQIA